jgi:hypothetical protein
MVDFADAVRDERQLESGYCVHSKVVAPSGASRTSCTSADPTSSRSGMPSGTRGTNAEQWSGWSRTDLSTAARPRTSCRSDPSLVRPELVEPQSLGSRLLSSPPDDQGASRQRLAGTHRETRRRPPG